MAQLPSKTWRPQSGFQGLLQILENESFFFFTCTNPKWVKGLNRLSVCPPSGRSDGVYKPCRHEKSPSKSNEVISPEILKMRAALFCIFTYLDTKTLLRAAEVCRDWKFVARHPAVWTRVLLENARISSKVRSEH